jgi:hypothetical protein
VNNNLILADFRNSVHYYYTLPSREIQACSLVLCLLSSCSVIILFGVLFVILKFLVDKMTIYVTK